jgi:multisubunit Na+/H+ antiporter MnhE subunit
MQFSITNLSSIDNLTPGTTTSNHHHSKKTWE